MPTFCRACLYIVTAVTNEAWPGRGRQGKQAAAVKSVCGSSFFSFSSSCPNISAQLQWGHCTLRVCSDAGEYPFDNHGEAGLAKRQRQNCANVSKTPALGSRCKIEIHIETNENVKQTKCLSACSSP